MLDKLTVTKVSMGSWRGSRAGLLLLALLGCGAVGDGSADGYGSTVTDQTLVTGTGNETITHPVIDETEPALFFLVKNDLMRSDIVNGSLQTPRKLWTLQPQPLTFAAFTVTLDALYLGDSTGISRMPKQGGTPVSISGKWSAMFPDPTGGAFVIVEDSYGNASLYHVAPSATSAVLLVGPFAQDAKLYVASPDAAYVYYVVRASIYRLRVADGSTTLLVTDSSQIANTVFGFRIDGAKLYWVNGSPSIMTLPGDATGATPTVAVTVPLDNVLTFTIDRRAFYVLGERNLSSGGFTGVPEMVPRDGSAAIEFVSSGFSVNDLMEITAGAGIAAYNVDAFNWSLHYVQLP
jgi:hypothetical protein